MKFPARLIAQFLCRLILGGWFFTSGLVKVPDPLAFQDSIRNFHLVNDPWPALLAVSLPWLEMLCGAGIVLRQLYAGSLAIVSGSLVIFIAAIASAWQRGLNIDCGCFGKLEMGISHGQHLLLNAALLGMGLWLLREESRRLRALPSPAAPSLPGASPISS